MVLPALNTQTYTHTKNQSFLKYLMFENGEVF